LVTLIKKLAAKQTSVVIKVNFFTNQVKLRFNLCSYL